MDEFSLKDRLKRIEDKLDLILDRFEIKPVAPPKQEWQKLADDGRRVDAIKAYRKQFRLGMRESVEAVEKYIKGDY